VQQKKAVQTRLLRWRNAFAAVLAASRRDADLTQAQVADEMGWARNTVTRIEGGTRSLAVEELMELCRLYRVEPLTLIGRVTRW
jgi:transcriptional regulator with XRE-family HTH domain